jgi:hypothetical protein
MSELEMACNDNRRSNPDNNTRERTTEARWATAEREVCTLLSNLIPEGSLVLNDVAFPYGNLDHLVIRQDGTVFLIETKSHRGKVNWDGRQLLINGRSFSSNPISQLNRSIPWVRTVTGPLFGRKQWIVAILTFPYAKVSVRRSVKRINVMPATRLLPFIRSYPVRMKNNRICKPPTDSDNDFVGCCDCCT